MIDIKPTVYWRSCFVQNPNDIFNNGFKPLSDNSESREQNTSNEVTKQWWQKGLDQANGTIMAVPSLTVSLTTHLGSAAIFPIIPPTEETQSAVSSTYIFGITAPTSIKYGTVGILDGDGWKKFYNFGEQIRPVEDSRVILDTHSFQASIASYSLRLRSSHPNFSDNLGQNAGRLLYSYEAATAYVPPENIFCAFKIIRGPQKYQVFTSSLVNQNEMYAPFTSFILPPSDTFPTILNPNYVSTETIPTIRTIENRAEIQNVTLDYSESVAVALDEVNEIRQRNEVIDTPLPHFGLGGKSFASAYTSIFSVLPERISFDHCSEKSTILPVCTENTYENRMQQQREDIEIYTARRNII